MLMLRAVNQSTSDSLPPRVAWEPVPSIGGGTRDGAPRSAGSSSCPVSLRAWTRVRLAATPRALYESLLIVVTVGAIWHLQQWIGGFLLLVALVGRGAWRVTDV